MERNDQKLRAVLVYILRTSKINFSMAAKINAELAAVSDALRGLDPTFADVLEQKRKEAAETLDSATQQIIAQYDDMIQQIERAEIV